MFHFILIGWLALGLATPASAEAVRADSASRPGTSRAPRRAVDSPTISPLGVEDADDPPPDVQTLDLRADVADERLDLQRRKLKDLRRDLTRLEGQVRSQDAFGFTSGELRVVGFNNTDIDSFVDTILNFQFRLDENIHGVFAPELLTAFDRTFADRIGIWQAFADFDDVGPFDRIRAGRQQIDLGVGLTLYNRVEGFNVTTEYGDTALQILFTGDLLLSAETEIFSGQRFGVYYIEEARNAVGLQPLHLGLYLKGPIGERLWMGMEYGNYGNRAVTTSNNNNYTEAFLAELKWTPSAKFGARVGYITQAEDFRGLSIDRDLSYHWATSSPLEDVLQTLSLASRPRHFPLPADRNEIAGFWDARFGIDAALPHSRYRLGLDWDYMRDFSAAFSNRDAQFNVFGVRVKRPVGKESWLEVRGRALVFDDSSVGAPAGTLGLARTNRSDFRVQFFGRF